MPPSSISRPFAHQHNTHILLPALSPPPSLHFEEPFETVPLWIVRWIAECSIGLLVDQAAFVLFCGVCAPPRFLRESFMLDDVPAMLHESNKWAYQNRVSERNSTWWRRVSFVLL